MQTAEAALLRYNALERMTNDLNFKLKPRGKSSEKMNNKEDVKWNAMRIKNPVVRKLDYTKSERGKLQNSQR
jgi:hypothetical protein